MPRLRLPARRRRAPGWLAAIACLVALTGLTWPLATRVQEASADPATCCRRNRRPSTP